jgi:hypothetical protein
MLGVNDFWQPSECADELQVALARDRVVVAIEPQETISCCMTSVSTQYGFDDGKDLQEPTMRIPPDSTLTSCMDVTEVPRGFPFEK